MRRAIVVMAFSCLSCAVGAGQSERKIALSPYTKNFVVLGQAKGVLSIDGGQGCIAIDEVTFSVPQAIVKPMHVSGLRFGVGAPHGRNDWSSIATSKVWPLDVTVKPGSQSKADAAMGCFEMPSNLVAGQYWLYMQMNVEDGEGHASSTYSGTKEYRKLIDAPK